jgi:hypothetical protein
LNIEGEAGKKGTQEQPEKSDACPHLKKHRWEKGQSGNPGGRPKGRFSLVTMLTKHLREHPEDAKLLVDNWVEMAIKKDRRALRAIESIVNRIDGPVPTALANALPDEPFEIKVTFRQNGSEPDAP